jgi:hypothetical protein
MWQHDMCCDVMWCDVTWCDVTWRDVMWCEVMWCDVTWRDVMWCDVTWRDVTWRDVTWRDVMWCDMWTLWSKLNVHITTWSQNPEEHDLNFIALLKHVSMNMWVIFFVCTNHFFSACLLREVRCIMPGSHLGTACIITHLAALQS